MGKKESKSNRPRVRSALPVRSPIWSCPVIEVSSYSELRSKLAEIEPSGPRHRLSFRGQVRDDGQMISSMARRLKRMTVPKLDLAEIYSGRALWMQAAHELAQQFLPGPPAGSLDAVPPQVRLVLAEAFLQHYGFQTYFIDATLDPDVAVCFALLEYDERYPIFEGESERPKLTRMAWYRSSKEPCGFIYVFDTPLWNPREIRHGDVIDLTALAPAGYNRIQEQQGVALYADPQESGLGDLAPLVKAIFRFPNPLPESGPALIRHVLLFPNPGADPIYRTLLQSRYIEITYVSNRVFAGWRRTSNKNGKSQYRPTKYKRRKKVQMYMRSLDIPEYHIDLEASLDFDIFRACDELLEPTFYFSWLKDRTGSIEHAVWGKKFSAQRKKWRKVFEKIKRAKPILLNSPLTELSNVDPSVATRLLELPEGMLNVFLEFSPYNFVGPFANDKTIRGIWLTGEKHSFLVNVFGAAKGKPWMGELCAFEWRSGGYAQTIELKGPNMRPYFLLILSLLQDVSAGKAEIVPPKRGEQYHQFRWEVNGGGEN